MKGREACRPRRQHELALRQGDELAVDDARLDRPDRQRHRGDLQPEARAHQRHAEQHDDDGRQGMEEIGDAQQHGRERAAEVARQRADRAADQECHGGGGKADGERRTAGIEQHRTNVAAETVSAERIRPGRRLHRRRADVRRPGRGEPRREDRQERDGQKDDYTGAAKAGRKEPARQVEGRGRAQLAGCLCNRGHLCAEETRIRGSSHA